MRKNRIDDRGRVTLPAELREGMGLAPGDEVFVEQADHAIVLRRSRSALEVFAELEGCITERNQVEPLDPMVLKRIWRVGD